MSFFNTHKIFPSPSSLTPPLSPRIEIVHQFPVGADTMQHVSPHRRSPITYQEPPSLLPPTFRNDLRYYGNPNPETFRVNIHDGHRESISHHTHSYGSLDVQRQPSSPDVHQHDVHATIREHTPTTLFIVIPERTSGVRRVIREDNFV